MDFISDYSRPDRARNAVVRGASPLWASGSASAGGTEARRADRHAASRFVSALPDEVGFRTDGDGLVPPALRYRACARQPRRHPAGVETDPMGCLVAGSGSIEIPTSDGPHIHLDTEALPLSLTWDSELRRSYSAGASISRSVPPTPHHVRRARQPQRRPIEIASDLAATSRGDVMTRVRSRGRERGCAGPALGRPLSSQTPQAARDRPRTRRPEAMAP